jgi:MFS family permease
MADSEAVFRTEDEFGIITPESRSIYRWGIFQGALYMVGETLLDPTLVLVAYLVNLTHSPIIFGLVLPIRDGLWYLPQIWVSSIVQSMPRKISFYRIGTVLSLICNLALALTINFVHQPELALMLFFVFYALSSLFSGFRGLPFMVVISKTIPPRMRGEFFAYRLALTGLFSIGASLFVKWVLDPANGIPFPSNFGILSYFFLGIAAVSLTIFCLFKEPPDTVLQPRISVKAQISRAWALTKNNRQFSSFISVSILVMLAGTATPFFAVYVQHSLGGSSGMVGVYLGITVVANLLCNFLLGRVSRRRGSHWLMSFGNLSGLVMLALVLALVVFAGPLKISGALASYWLMPVFALWGARNAGINISLNSLLLDIAPPHDNSLYIGFANSVQGIFTLLAGLSGLVVDTLGFSTLLVITISAQLGGWYLSTHTRSKRDAPLETPLIS